MDRPGEHVAIRPALGPRNEREMVSRRQRSLHGEATAPDEEVDLDQVDLAIHKAVALGEIITAGSPGLVARREHLHDGHHLMIRPMEDFDESLTVLLEELQGNGHRLQGERTLRCRRGRLPWPLPHHGQIGTNLLDLILRPFDDVHPLVDPRDVGVGLFLVDRAAKGDDKIDVEVRPEILPLDIRVDSRGMDWAWLFLARLEDVTASAPVYRNPVHTPS